MLRMIQRSVKQITTWHGESVMASFGAASDQLTTKLHRVFALPSNHNNNYHHHHLHHHHDYSVEMCGMGHMDSLETDAFEKETSSVSLLPEWMSGLWMAAPKSKVSRSKKRMRAAGKGLKNILHIHACDMCGKMKLKHRLCMDCFKKGKYDCL